MGESLQADVNIEEIRRTAQEHGRTAGRASRRGEPLADTVEQLPGRLYLVSLFDIQIRMEDRENVRLLKELKKRREALKQALEHATEEQRRLKALIKDLAPEHEEDVRKDVEDQNLHLAERVRSANREVERWARSEKTSELELEQIDEEIENRSAGTKATVAVLHEQRISVLHLHDQAYRTALSTDDSGAGSSKGAGGS